jgi:hypothetical protein
VLAVVVDGATGISWVIGPESVGRARRRERSGCWWCRWQLVLQAEESEASGVVPGDPTQADGYVLESVEAQDRDREVA